MAGYKGMLEQQIRMATERLIPVNPEEPPEYLQRIAKLAGDLIRE